MHVLFFLIFTRALEHVVTFVSSEQYPSSKCISSWGGYKFYTVILLEPYCGTITEHGLPVISAIKTDQPIRQLCYCQLFWDTIGIHALR